MELRVIFQGKNDLPQLEVPEPIIDFSHISKISFGLIEGGMSSGEPSVLIFSETEQGTIILQTSLDKFLTGAQMMSSGATERWGWKRQEGHISFPPMEKEMRKALLESIQKELKEWDDLDDNG